MNTYLMLITFFILIKLGHFYKLINKCPIAKHCRCDLDLKILKCYCSGRECLNEFRNETLSSFNEIQIKNNGKISTNLFNESQLSKETVLKFYRPSIIESFAFNSIEIKHLEIVYVEIKQIEQGAFKNMKCEFLSFISFGKNIEFKLDYFDSDTFIKALSIDQNFNSNSFKRLFFLNDSANFTQDELDSYWTSRATVKNLFIKDVRGIETLDPSWAPRFESLDRIELIRTDIRIISRSFSRLHSKNLKYLTISKSKLETIESNVFEDLKSLRMLDLSFNSIKFIELKAFHGLTSLKVLKLKSISTNNFIDDLDVCMLSFLPCNINVYLDDYDGSMFSCALIYLNEIKYDKSLDYVDLLKSLTHEELNYKRDIECKLKETLEMCFNLTKYQNNKCSYKSFSFENSTKNQSVQQQESPLLLGEQDDIFALVELTLNKTDPMLTSTVSYITNHTETDDIFALVEMTLNKTTSHQIESSTTANKITETSTKIITTSTIENSSSTLIKTSSIITSTLTPLIQKTTTSINENSTYFLLNFTKQLTREHGNSTIYLNLTSKISIDFNETNVLLNKTKNKTPFVLNEINTHLHSSTLSTNSTRVNLHDNKYSTKDSTNQPQSNQTAQNELFVFSQSSASNQSYNNLLIIFKISISLLIFLLFLMSIANLYLLYSNRLSKGYSSNQVNIANNPNEDKSISLRSFGFRKSSIFFMRENSVGDAHN